MLTIKQYNKAYRLAHVEEVGMYGHSIANMRFISRKTESITMTDASDAVKLWQKITDAIQEHDGKVSRYFTRYFPYWIP